MKRMTRILFAVVVVVVGLIVAGVAILKSIDFNSYRGVIAQQVDKALGRKLTIAGNLKLGISFAPSLTVENVSLANAPWGSRPQMATLKRLSAQVELWPLLSGQVRVTRIELDGLDAVLETDGHGHGNWMFGQAAKPAPSTMPVASGGKPPIVPLIQDVIVKDAKVTYRQPNGRRVKAVIDKLTAATGGLNQPIQIAVNGSVDSVKLAVNGKVGPLALLLSGKGAYPVKLTAVAFGVQASVDGTLAYKGGTPAPDFAITLKAGDLAAVAKNAAAVLPAIAGVRLPAVPLDLAAHMLSTGKGYGLESIHATLGSSDLAGRVAIEQAADNRPQVTAELNSHRIDVASLLAAMPPAPSFASRSSASVASAGGSSSGRLFAATPLPLDGLRTVDAKVGFQGDSVVLPGGVELTKSVVGIQLDKGRLQIAPLETGLEGGTVKGTATLDAVGKQAAVDVHLDANGVGAAKLLTQMTKSDLLQGAPTSLTVRLSGKGTSVREIMAGLNGEATLHMLNGRIHNKALGLIGADVVTQLANALNPLAAKQDYTTLTCAVAHFQIKDGIAKADRGIAAQSDQVNVVGGGTVDLRNETLDLAIMPEARQGLGINLGSTLAGLVKVQGTLAHPAVGIDRLGAAKTAASIGAAVATGGLSMLAQALLNKSEEDPHPCQTALAMAPTASKAAPTQQSSGPTGAAGGAIKDIGNALKGLFGGK